MIVAALRAVPLAALKTTAHVLRLVARTSETLADVLRPTATPQQQPTPRPESKHLPPAPSAVANISALAASPARDVIGMVGELSMEQLAELHDYESRHRRRRTVLDAIDRAAAPPPVGRDGLDDDLADDVREPDKVVYTTQTSRR